MELTDIPQDQVAELFEVVHAILGRVMLLESRVKLLEDRLDRVKLLEDKLEASSKLLEEEGS